MYHTNAIVMNAAEETIFEAAADLERWPDLSSPLPLYSLL